MPDSSEHLTFSIRKATVEDAQGILECLRVAFEKYRNAYTPGAFLDTILTPETLLERLANMTIFVATTPSGQVVGTVAGNVIRPGEGHIRGMAVRPTWQGAGVAAQLLGRVECELREKQCIRISLDTTEPLQRAMRFYEKNGYRRTGEITDFFGMQLFEYVKELPALPTD